MNMLRLEAPFLKAEAYDFSLPRDLVARKPPENRGEARLMVLHRQTGAIEHRHIGDLLEYVRAEQVYVNNSKIRPGWIRLMSPTGRRDYAYFIRPLGNDRWLVFLPVPPEAAGQNVFLTDGTRGRIDRPIAKDRWELSFVKEPNLAKLGTSNWESLVHPIDPVDARRYEPLYARVEGSAFCPSAGVHLTEEILSKLHVRELTLHIEVSTGYQLRSNDPHPSFDPEFYEIPVLPSGPVVAVGTTVTKALETWARTGEARGWSDLFIAPPFEFKAVKALLTNLHRPKETLLVLACAFGGTARVMNAYQEAIRERYRFSDYGDSMLIL